MAYPVIETADDTQGNAEPASTSITFSYPSNLAADDLILLIIGTSDNDSASTWPSGFTELIDTSSYPGLHVGYKWAAGTESGSDTVTMSGTNDANSYICLRITGADPNTDPEAGAAETDLDHGGVTASWGSDDNLFIAAGVTYAFGDPAHSSYPSGWTTYTNNEQHTSYFLGNVLQVAATESASASADPGTFSTSGGSSPAYKSTTIVVRPTQGTTLDGVGSASSDADANLTGTFALASVAEAASTSGETLTVWKATNLGKVSLSDVSLGDGDKYWDVRTRVSAGSGELRMTLYETGVGVIDEWTINPTSNFATYSRDITTAAASISNWDNLEIWFQGYTETSATYQISSIQLRGPAGIIPLESVATAAADVDAAITTRTFLTADGRASADVDATATTRTYLVATGNAAAQPDASLPVARKLTADGQASADVDATATTRTYLVSSGNAAADQSALLKINKPFTATGNATAATTANLEERTFLLGTAAAAAQPATDLDRIRPLPSDGQAAAQAGDSPIKVNRSVTADGQASADTTATLTTRTYLAADGQASADATTTLTTRTYLIADGQASADTTATLNATFSLASISTAAADSSNTITTRSYLLSTAGNAATVSANSTRIRYTVSLSTASAMSVATEPRLVEVMVPDGMAVAAGPDWDSGPTTGLDLWAQIDEGSAINDGDYIRGTV